MASSWRRGVWQWLSPPLRVGGLAAQPGGVGLPLLCKSRLPAYHLYWGNAAAARSAASDRDRLYKFNGPIPSDALQIQFARSSGPGGQNVNKVNTKADVRFHVASAEWLPTEVREKLQEQQQSRINKNGELVVAVSDTRSQKKNLQLAMQRILDMCREASAIERETSAETKQRIKKLYVIAMTSAVPVCGPYTRTHAHSQSPILWPLARPPDSQAREDKRRLENKKKHAQKKADRRRLD
ncbi:uncharacterized protein MONBRDRAFT_26602 [Monosiga brevicollis MX1]|uniref:Prokaryotic-type class I peptide chain release factors domain-containing protein n=1 Tax=Monosiga brevicollis TaxID=81824 RepID=A9V2U5_MONBE|nr:uncharacterized protein MONBRDRAFT_26602 [Monosiga brevicollis MX1]EDQ87946.1 predicted protein [Monosiga brevicollis MX1]|eukprot:XP_001747022.1 hypothetical protein [Monosiga brevicollis MX1]